jgi:hypothetical protein
VFGKTQSCKQDPFSRHAGAQTAHFADNALDVLRHSLFTANFVPLKRVVEALTLITDVCSLKDHWSFRRTNRLANTNEQRRGKHRHGAGH